MTDEPSRVLFGLRKDDLYIAIERDGAKFVLIHEQALGGSVVRSAVALSPAAAKRFAVAIIEELAIDEANAAKAAAVAEHADPHLVALANAGDTK